ncbi:MAG: LuxR C-terminal-related transcriptional regulator [Sporichthyaceae bacterium]
MPSESLTVVRLPDLAPYVEELRTATGSDVTLGGLSAAGSVMTLSTLSGNRSESLRNLKVDLGYGLGGKALALGRPMRVVDYATASGITHHYDKAIDTEGIRAMLAVPFRAPDGVRGVIYAAMRRPMVISDRVLDRAVTVTRRMEYEAAVASEVNRRVSGLIASAAPAENATRDQCLRDVHAELALIRDAVHADARDKIDLLLSAMARAMGTGQPALAPSLDVRLTRREIDVLTQVATGATNLEAAQRLGLTAATTKSYLRDAARKLGARNRVEAVTAARRAGLIP